MDTSRFEIFSIVVLAIWGLLFSGNLVSAGKEMIRPWPIYGDMDAPVKIFFSPTCPACKQAVKEIVENGLLDKKDLALFPIAKNAEDQERICLLECSLRSQKTNLEMALNECWQPGCKPISVGLRDKLRLRINLFRNKIALSRMGINRVPVVIARRPLIVDNDSGFDLFESSAMNGCGFSGEKDSGECGESYEMRN